MSTSVGVARALRNALHGEFEASRPSRPSGGLEQAWAIHRARQKDHLTACANLRRLVRKGAAGPTVRAAREATGRDPGAGVGVGERGAGVLAAGAGGSSERADGA